ncbi:unnamed protein product [Rangifer tarandus platyrhynchus]|uniref:Uncharacterized protein n=1 Tax=Rangifer tarandus platyrhynchus TaxID=3082113 RepID=A0AC59ZNH1_RANTA
MLDAEEVWAKEDISFETERSCAFTAGLVRSEGPLQDSTAHGPEPHCGSYTQSELKVVGSWEQPANEKRGVPPEQRRRAVLPTGAPGDDRHQLGSSEGPHGDRASFRADNGKHPEDYLKQARLNVVQRDVRCWLMKAAHSVCCTWAQECKAYLAKGPPPSSRAHPSNLSHSPSLQPFPRFLASASSQLTCPPPSALLQECYCRVLSQQSC